MPTVRPAEAPILVDVPTAARMLSCGLTNVYELIKRGEVTTVKLDRLWRIPVAALEDFVARRHTVHS